MGGFGGWGGGQSKILQLMQQRKEWLGKEIEKRGDIFRSLLPSTSGCCSCKEESGGKSLGSRIRKTLGARIRKMLGARIRKTLGARFRKSLEVRLHVDHRLVYHYCKVGNKTEGLNGVGTGAHTWEQERTAWNNVAAHSVVYY